MAINALEVKKSFDIFKAKRLDESDPDKLYIGYAVAGVLNTEAKWSIVKIEKVSNVTSWEWANGNIAANKVWDDRATYTYT